MREATDRTATGAVLFRAYQNANLWLDDVTYSNTGIPESDVPREGCQLCHAPGITPTTDCATCHPAGRSRTGTTRADPYGDSRQRRDDLRCRPSTLPARRATNSSSGRCTRRPCAPRVTPPPFPRSTPMAAGTRAARRRTATQAPRRCRCTRTSTEPRMLPTHVLRPASHPVVTTRGINCRLRGQEPCGPPRRRLNHGRRRDPRELSDLSRAAASRLSPTAPPPAVMRIAPNRTATPRLPTLPRPPTA